jgi:hypothetical protein
MEEGIIACCVCGSVALRQVGHRAEAKGYCRNHFAEAIAEAKRQIATVDFYSGTWERPCGYRNRGASNYYQRSRGPCHVLK